MTLIVVGLNHQTAPVQVRERCYLSNGSLSAALETLKRDPLLSEVAIISTCNRLEIYAVVDNTNTEAGYEAVANYLSVSHDLPDVRSLLIFHQGQEAVEHLMRVAAG